MTWNPLAEPTDYVILGGHRSPGIAEIRNAHSPRRLRRMNGYGLSGATVRFAGVGLSEPLLAIRLYTEEDWDAWDAFRAVVARPPLGERARPLDIWHPILEMQGVSAVLVEDVGQPMPTGNGEWTIEIKLVEYRRPEFTLSTPEGAQDQPTDPVERYIDQNTAEIHRLTQEYAAS